MTAERVSADRFRVVDLEGERLDVHRATPADIYAAVVIVDTVPVGVSLEDGLALLSFLADALGVERYVPEQAP